MKAGIRAAALWGLGIVLLSGCFHRIPEPTDQRSAIASEERAHPFVFWNNATVYFLLIDRFLDGDTTNDHALGRPQDGGVLRSFRGGDLKGVLEMIRAGYFDSLGVDVIWMTPFVEQIHGGVDEGWGKTYGFHGYWARDWTAVDPAFGTREDLRALVDAAHRHHIRVLMDAVINHTGPVTPEDPAWPDDWVRTSPKCTYQSYATTVDCMLSTLPDIRTDSNDSVGLPPFLVEKWRREGRLDAERASLDSFFARTRYPRAPRYYLIKWLTDWVRDFGFDGYRMDTAKHFEAGVSLELKHEADLAFADWKRANPGKVLDSLPFFMVGEVYGWAPSQGRRYSYGDSTVDFFAHGYDGLINFAFAHQAAGSLDSLDSRLSGDLHGGPLAGVSFLNYISSHDDGSPYDADRKDPLGAGTRLLLSPGGAQIYYGDETARPLRVAGAQGDANLRSDMNWRDLGRGDSTRHILEHWRKLGEFRRQHPAVGAGVHRTLQAKPYIFSRILATDSVDDRVVVAMDQPRGYKLIPVTGVFADGTPLTDGYSGEDAVVRKGAVALNTPFPLVLLGERMVAPSDTVIVNVINNYALPVDVFAMANGTTFRMGTVNPGIESQFVLRKDLLATNRQVTFVAQATAVGPRFTTDPMYVSPGDVIDFTIELNLIGSRAVVRP